MCVREGGEGERGAYVRGGDRQHTHWNAMDLHGSSEDARMLPNSNKVNNAITAELGFRTVTIEFAGCRGRIPRERIDGKTMNSKLPLSSCSCDVDGLGRPNEWRCLYRCGVFVGPPITMPFSSSPSPPPPFLSGVLQTTLQLSLGPEKKVV